MSDPVPYNVDESGPRLTRICPRCGYKANVGERCICYDSEGRLTKAALAYMAKQGKEHRQRYEAEQAAYEAARDEGTEG